MASYWSQTNGQLHISPFNGGNKILCGFHKFSCERTASPKKENDYQGENAGANLRDRASQSHNLSTLYACSLNRWELLQDTPGNWSNFQKASQAQHKEQARVGEEDKEMLGSFSFWYYHGYPPEIFKMGCCTLNHCLNLTLLFICVKLGKFVMFVNSWGIPVLTAVIQCTLLWFGLIPQDARLHGIQSTGK